MILCHEEMRLRRSINISRHARKKKMLTNFYAIQGQRRAVVRGRAGGDFSPSVIWGFRKQTKGKCISISPPGFSNPTTALLSKQQRARLCTTVHSWTPLLHSVHTWWAFLAQNCAQHAEAYDPHFKNKQTKISNYG